MNYNHGLEEKRFKQRWEQQKKAYVNAGMTKEAIEQMYEFEREVFNSERKYIQHYEDFILDEEADTGNSNVDGKMAKLREKYLPFYSVNLENSLSKDKSMWLNMMENAEIYGVIMEMSSDDIEIITLFAFQGYTVGEIAKMKGIAHQNVSKKVTRIRKKLKKFSTGGAD